VFPCCEGESTRRAPAGDFDIIFLARAIGHIGGGQIGDDSQRGLQLIAEQLFHGFERRHPVHQGGNLLLQSFGHIFVTLGHRRADRF